MKLIAGIMFVVLGVKIIVVHKFMGRGSIIDFSSPYLHYPIGVYFIFSGVYFCLDYIKKIFN